MSDWKAMWESLGIAFAALAAIAGILKLHSELKLAREHKISELKNEEASSQLKRTEFFLQQHRRLFDDPDLSDVLSLIDSDSSSLTNLSMIDKKRKFLAYLEEMALLVQSNQINRDVAFYMFGYYARAAIDGKNFQYGIRMTEDNWGLLFSFKSQADIFIKNYAPNKTSHIKL